MIRPAEQVACFVSKSASSVKLRTQVPVLGLHATNTAFSDFGSSFLNAEMVETAAQSFEPQVNTPALSAFLIIAVVFSLLQLRINSVRGAAERRTEALNNLRQVKSSQLDSVDTTSTPSEEEVNAAVLAYKQALENELQLRTVIPGVRIVAPNDPKRAEKDISAAKQFLDMDLEADDLLEGGTISSGGGDSSLVNGIEDKSKKEKARNDLLLQSRRRFDGKTGDSVSSNGDETEGEGLSNGAKAVLLGIALTQVALLIMLSFDPMTTDSVFTTLGGDPPTDLPRR